MMNYLKGSTLYRAQQYCIIIHTYNNYNYNITSSLMQHVSAPAVEPEDDQMKSKKNCIESYSFLLL